MYKKLAPAKNVLVKFVGDDDVIENITLVNNKSSRKKKNDIVYDHSKADAVLLSPSSDDEYQAPTALRPMQNEAEGKELFQFSKQNLLKTPTSGKKSLQNGHKNSPVSTPKSSVKPTKSSLKKTLSRTPQSNCNTPYSLRRGTRKPLFEDTCESDPEESDGEGSDESCSDAEEEPTSISPKKRVETFAETYFTAQKKLKTATSNHTLSKISLPKVNVKDLQELYQNSSHFHGKEKTRLCNEYKKKFKKWLLQIEKGFNILLYGIGSKMKLMQKILAECLSEHSSIEISGFHPTLTIKQVLNTITEDVINCDASFSNIFEQTEFIKKHFESENRNFYLLVHNIDGLSLRAVKCQAVLANLASSPMIHVIASVDHINCSLIWDQIMLSQFRWIWHHVPTYEPYILETSYENSLLRKQSNVLLLSSLLHVFHSLTPNNRGVFLIIAKHQLNKQDSSGYLGLTFQDWYQECREAFLVNSESTMNAQMSEFKNHKLLSSRKSPDGIECWYIPIDGNTLQQFLERDEIK